MDIKKEKSKNPVRENVEKRSKLPDLRDVFYHAWDNRKTQIKNCMTYLNQKV